MHLFDGIAAVLLIGLAIRGYGRGLVQQIGSLLAVSLGLAGGLYLHGAAADMLPSFGHPVLRLVAAFTVVFVAVALAVNVLARILRTLVQALLLGVFDRLLGALLGVLLGVQVLMVVVLLVVRYLPEGPDWLAEARSAPPLFAALEAVLPLLPEHFLEFLDRPSGASGGLLERVDGLRQEAGDVLRKVQEAKSGAAGGA